jgi:gliding motility-associated-like protein
LRPVAREVLDLSVADAFEQLTWSTDETTLKIEITAAGTYSVSTRDVHGCLSSDEIIIAKKPTPTLSVVSAKTAIAAGESVQLEAVGADMYTWSPGITLSDSTIANPIASPRETTAYRVTGSFNDGCSATASVTLQVTGEIVNITVPVLFSPNGDNVNEILVIEGVENYPDCHFAVFDKRGGRVFGTVGYKNNWDGTVNGSPLPEGVYYYVFGCPNRKSMTGTVAVVR